MEWPSIEVLTSMMQWKCGCVCLERGPNLAQSSAGPNKISEIYVRFQPLSLLFWFCCKIKLFILILWREMFTFHLLSTYAVWQTHPQKVQLVICFQCQGIVFLFFFRWTFIFSFWLHCQYCRWQVYSMVSEPLQMFTETCISINYWRLSIHARNMQVQYRSIQPC